MSSDEKIEVENINVPGTTSRVNRAKYTEMRKQLLKVLPRKRPGLTQAEMCEAVLPFLCGNLFPEGKTSRWWVKTVQLDLEAKGLVVRTDQKPLTWFRP